METINGVYKAERIGATVFQDVEFATTGWVDCGCASAVDFVMLHWQLNARPEPAAFVRQVVLAIVR